MVIVGIYDLVADVYREHWITNSEGEAMRIYEMKFKQPGVYQEYPADFELRVGGYCYPEEDFECVNGTTKTIYSLGKPHRDVPEMDSPELPNPTKDEIAVLNKDVREGQLNA